MPLALKCVLAFIGLSALASVVAADPGGPLDQIAERYVKLVLAMGGHDRDYVDAYYGPPEWKGEVELRKASLDEIRAEAAGLASDVRHMEASSDAMVQLRQEYLARQLEALVGRVDVLRGKKMTFDEESRTLFGAVSPAHPEEEFRTVLAELEQLLPGKGPVMERYAAFRKRFVIPREKVDAVFRAAIEECRRRTLLHITLPKGESFELQYVTGKSWAGYNWYKGDYHSVIQVNTDVPITMDRAIDLACHEGYPGHHVYNVLLEKNLVKARGWVEFTVYPLFSPQSLIAEGSANYGIKVAFPGSDHVVFEREKLFPLAGIDPGQAELFDKVQTALARLNYAGNEAARRYLEGRLDAAGTQKWLETYALMSPDRAKQRLQFFDQYRSYVINYNLGQDLVKDYIEKRSAGNANRRWEQFQQLLESPRLPGGLQ
jgi:hypothetical protein